MLVPQHQKQLVDAFPNYPYNNFPYKPRGGQFGRSEWPIPGMQGGFMLYRRPPFGESPATKEDFEQASNDTYKNAWAGESGYEESSQVPPAVKDAYKEDGASGAYSDLKELVDNMLKQKVEERWSLSQVATKLDLQIPKRLSEWLKETHTHEGAEIAAIYAEFFEPMQAKCGGDIDVSDLKAKMTNEQLDEVITTSGKKSPVQKKLFTRLHYELEYPLNEKQAKKIGVTPHKPQPTAEEGVPDLSAEPEPELESEPEPEE